MIEKYRFKVKLLCKLAYIGRNYHGFQYMGEETKTIQGQFAKVLDTIKLTNFKLQTCSRTDATVNALEHPLAISLYTDGITLTKLDKLQKSINHYLRRLDEDISVSDQYVVPHTFYPKDCEKKLYHYNIVSNLGKQDKNCIHAYERAWPQKEFLEFEKFKTILSNYKGTHEFYNFIKFDKHNRDRPTVFPIDDIQLKLNVDEERGFQYYKIVFEARRFSRYQIRFMTNFAVKTMLGFYTEDDLKKFLVEKQDLGTFDQHSRVTERKNLSKLAKGREPAPGKGLFLNKVYYNDEITQNWMTVEKFREIAEQFYDFQNTETTLNNNIINDQKEFFDNFYNTYLFNPHIKKEELSS